MAKSAIVTGGARGIGRCLVLKLAEMGYDVTTNYTSDSSGAKVESLAAEVQERFGRTVVGVKADVSSPDDCAKTVETAVEQFGDTIDVLVNNAGVDGKPFMESDPDGYAHTIGVDLLGTMHMCHFALPHMLDSDTCIVNLSSVAIFVSNPGGAADYIAAKAGIVGFTRALASDCARRGVRVNVIAPGFIKTEILNGYDDETLAGWEESIPLGKMGDVQDIATTLEFLIENPFMTGQLISPNGGQVMH